MGFTVFKNSGTCHHYYQNMIDPYTENLTLPRDKFFVGKLTHFCQQWNFSQNVVIIFWILLSRYHHKTQNLVKWQVKWVVFFYFFRNFINLLIKLFAFFVIIIVHHLDEWLFRQRYTRYCSKCCRILNNIEIKWQHWVKMAFPFPHPYYKEKN